VVQAGGAEIGSEQVHGAAMISLSRLFSVCSFVTDTPRSLISYVNT
jgi:hypothetical protein